MIGDQNWAEYLRASALRAGATAEDLRTLGEYIAEGDDEAAIGLVWSLNEDCEE